MIINEMELDMIRKTRSIEELHLKLQNTIRNTKNVKTKNNAAILLTKISKLTIGDYMKLRDGNTLEKTYMRV